MIKVKNKSLRKLFVVITLTSFFIAQTSSVFGAALIPGFYGSTSSDITAPSVNALPVLKEIVQGVSSLEESSDNGLIVHQDESSAIIDWDSFNIGANAWVHFDQQENSSWKALNRIYDQSPSLIYGKLTADGQVYLINQNGIFFSSNSTVNVGSLVASSLNIADDDFLEGTLSFIRENYIDPDEELSEEAAVWNKGTITAADGGSVFLLGTAVENDGEISAYLGWAALAAGDEITLKELENNDVIYKRVYITENPGEVYNSEDGVITADLGQAGMYGSTVTQNGIIRSVTAVTNDGRIELLASEKVIMGEGSVTSTPVSSSSEEFNSTFKFSGGEIEVGSLYTVVGDDEDTADDETVTPERIELYGTVLAPSGSVNMEASERIYLGEESTIDVSGLWVTMPVSEKTVEVQLNSVELADDYGQKDGILLGETVTISALLGSSIGDVSDYIISRGDLTAEEMATEGGTIALDAGSGDIILRDGSLLDVSGGGINYTGGTIDTTKLVSINNVVYDISDADEWETYESILGDYTKIYERYGITETYSGIYYGGVAPLSSYVEGFQEGSDAGTITLIASSMALDGTIDASVTQGLYQVYYPSDDEEEIYDAMGISVPTAGKLTIGDKESIGWDYDFEESDPFVDSVVISLSVDLLPDDFDADSAFPEEREATTYISSELINEAGLGILEIYTRTGLTIEDDAEINLAAGGEFKGYARSIVVEGGIYVPGGLIDLTLFSNYTTETSSPIYVSQEELGHERIYLASGSVLSVAGEQVDNSQYGTDEDDEYETGLLEGGEITISDETLYGEGVIVAEGAYIDVSGGYEIDEDGNVSGGDAGSLSIQGVTIILEGDLAGYSISGMNGGSVSLFAGDVTVTDEDDSSTETDIAVDEDIPEELQNALTLDDEFFADTGFTDITLKAYNDIEISSGAELSPSYVKFDVSEGGGSLDDSQDGSVSFITVSDEYLGDSSITLLAGETFEGDVKVDFGTEEKAVRIGSDSEIVVGNGGTIEIAGNYIETSGYLYAPGGSIEMDAEEIIVRSGSLISAAGYVTQDTEPLTTGLSLGYSVADGGDVTLSASLGDLVIEDGAVIDVSGSETVTDYVWDEDGDITKEEIASAPGSVTLSFYGDLLMDGELKADAGLEGLNGGTLVISRENDEESLDIGGEEISSYLSMGFDSITLRSWYEIVFTDSMDLEVPRDLTIDAPIISASGEGVVSLTSPWITLTNTYDYVEDLYEKEQGDGALTLIGDFIDITGYITLSSLETVELISATDIRLNDYYYNKSYQDTRWGGLEQSGDLVLQADRIYTETLASFLIKTDKDLTILDNGDNLTGSIYSAGSSLTLEAANIYMYGDIYAPLGEIVLTALSDDGIVYLGDGSTLSTYIDAYVNYGLLDDEGIFWGLTDESGTLDTDSEVETAPTGSVTVEGENVIMDDGAEIDVSGGGTVFAYQFLAGTDGTEDPLGDSDQYVILLDNSVYSPGETIIIGENEEIPAGEYYILSDEYAFVEGAIILTDIGTGINISEYSTTEEGYTVVSGTTSTAGTDLSSSTETHYYSVRDAEDVLSEGYYEVAELTAGDAGSVTLAGDTTILEGTIYGEALDDTYSGATLRISGTDVIVTAGGNEYVLPDDFDPTGEILDQIAEEMIGKLVLSDETVSGMGLESIILGDEESTSTLTVQEDVTLEVQSIEFNAADSIYIEGNAVITAVSEESDSETDEEESGGAVVFNSSEGTLYIADTASVYASDNIELNANTFDISGSMQLGDGGALSITSGTIYFVSDEDSDRTGTGAYITQSLWSYLSSADIIELGEGSEIIFEDSFDITVDSEIILDATLIESDDSGINISSGSVTCTNSGEAWEDSVSSGTGTLSVTADEIYLSEGTVTLGGLSDINLSSTGDVTIQGSGAFITGDADLSIEAASVASSLLETDDGYDAMDYTIDAGSGAVTIASNGASYTETAIAGGSFEVMAQDIIQSGVLNMTGAYITMTASGSGEDSGIFLEDGAVIYAAGNDSAPGGSVELVAENGIVSIASSAVIDVSAGSQGDAGEIAIESPSYAAVIEGSLKGSASDGGTGGSFTLDTASIEDLGDLIDILVQGGIDGSIGLRARKGDITLDAEDELVAEEVTMSADGTDGEGDINIYGTIDTSGADSSVVGIYAGGDLNLYSGSSITGSSSGADIELRGEEGLLFEDGAVINAGGGDDAAVTFASIRSDSGLNMTLDGSITGADSVTATSVKVYEIEDGDVDSTDIGDIEDDTNTYMADASTLKTQLFSSLETDDGTDLYFTPGIEVTSNGDLTIDSQWELSDWRYDTDGDDETDTAGSLIIRAAGDLTIDASIKDAPTDNEDLYKDTDTMGWDITVSAGSDLTAADPMDTLTDTEAGDLTIKSGVLVYTERGDLGFSSAGDTTINKVNLNKLVSESNMGFNIGTYDGAIYGAVGGSLIINGGAIQSSLGDIDIEVEGDLQLKRSSGYLGTIRSLGAATSESLTSYWEYEAGGDISLSVWGDILGTPTENDAWDALYTVIGYDEDGAFQSWDEWGASFSGSNGLDVSQGIVAMSGGDIYIKAGGDVTAGIGDFGEGDIAVYSGGDLNGRFLVADGTGELYAAGDFGTGFEGQQIELLDAEVTLTAGGSVELGTVVNPTVANTDLMTSSFASYWNLTYSTDTSVAINAILGDVLLTGETTFYDEITDQGDRVRLLPANVSISAGGDINFLQSFVMAPAADGQLVLSAGGDISGECDNTKRATIYMSDMDPDDVYGDMSGTYETRAEVSALLDSMTSKYEHDEDVLHSDDETPIVIEAGGDISDIKLYLPKAAEITAGGDITDIYYYGQNTDSDDVSVIKAGGDISFSTDITGTDSNTGIVQNGPGTLIVTAGESIDLGTTDGIQSVGNMYNSYLSDDDNDLVVIAGIELDITLDELEEFFTLLREAGAEYSELLAEGDLEGAEAVVAEVREEVIDPLLEEDEDKGTGDIDMVNSQINVTGGSGGIYIVALGEVNVGKTTFTDSGSVASDSGIYTTAGGAINIFSVGDLNVNESRVMTFAGGDITVWTDEGDINAGRGSKASVNATDSHAVYDEETGWSVEWEAPAVGSGIRTLTFDPDGLEGPEEEPLAGDVYLFAPEGEIDAGEAGISGTNVILGAIEVVNAQNISFSQGSVGVPVSTTSVSLSGISGVTSLADMANVVQEVTSAISESREESLQKAMEAMADFISKWLNVEVLGFYEDGEEG